jgi:hypothetical protein
VEQKVFFDNEKGLKLCGILSNPTEDEGIPIVLLCHGLNSGKDSTTNLALECIFSENDIATFRFDFFAHGESEGAIEDRSVGEFVDDILQAITFLKTCGYEDFGICGSSFGGLASVIAASRNNDLLVMALKAPGMGQTSRHLPNYREDFIAKSWITAGTRVSIPTLIVHGSADKDVEVAFGKMLAESMVSSKMEIFEGADHRFTDPQDSKRCTALMAGFIIDHLR